MRHLNGDGDDDLHDDDGDNNSDDISCQLS